MKRQEKRMITIIIVVGVIIIGGIWLIKNVNSNNKKENKQEENIVTEKYVEVLEDGTKLNKSNKLKEIKKIEGMEITGIQLTNKDGVSRIIAVVTNMTNQEIELTPIKLTLYDDKNKVLEEVNGLISPMKAGESVQLNMGISVDYANAYDFKVEKK